MVLVTHRRKGLRAGGGRISGGNKEEVDKALGLGSGLANASTRGLQLEAARVQAGCWQEGLRAPEA